MNMNKKVKTALYIISLILVFLVFAIAGKKMGEYVEKQEKTAAENVPDQTAEQAKEASSSADEEKTKDDSSKPDATQKTEADKAEGNETTEQKTTETGEKPVTEDLEMAVQTKLASMTLEQKVAQMFVITPEALTGAGTVVQAGEQTKAALAANPVGGLIYMAQNLTDPEQTKEMMACAMAFSKEITGLPMFLGIDEEGGTVTRVAQNPAFGVTDVGDMREIGVTGNVELAYQAGQTIGAYLHELGFNLDFAPVADVLTNDANEVVYYRSFGSDAAMVSQMVERERNGLEENQVLACIKHFPGHGATSGDTHDGIAYVDQSWEELQTRELIPFQDQINRNVSMIMVGHFSLPQVTGDDTPCSLSGTIITEKLRGEMGYDGIVITDALNMGAVSSWYTSAEAAVMAVQAGVDLLLMPSDFPSAYQAVLAACESGEIPQERIDASVTRILNVKLNMET
mgnify:CR=1 FL=1